MKQLILLGVVVIGLLAFFIFKLVVSPENDLAVSNTADYYISTTTEGDDKLKKMGLYDPSEDVSYILDTGKLSYPKVKMTDDDDYEANPNTTWIIDLQLMNGGIFNKKELGQLFDEAWRKNYVSDIHGHSTGDNKWTYVFAGGTPETYDKIQVAVELREIFNVESPDYNPAQLQRYITELNSRIEKYPGKIILTERESIAKAIAKGQEIVAFNQEFNRDEIIILKSDSTFSGLKAWDVLRSIGLQWGDGDQFHWNNQYDYGSDLFFSVWTTTEPGYFLPESVKAGHMNPADLVFGFSIPRSADPEHVFDVMAEAVKYAQKRSGGTIIDKDGHPFNEEQERKKLMTLVNNMKTKGIVPGSEDALRIFR